MTLQEAFPTLRAIANGAEWEQERPDGSAQWEAGEATLSGALEAVCSGREIRINHPNNNNKPNTHNGFRE